MSEGGPGDALMDDFRLRFIPPGPIDADVGVPMEANEAVGVGIKVMIVVDGSYLPERGTACVALLTLKWLIRYHT